VNAAVSGRLNASAAAGLKRLGSPKTAPLCQRIVGELVVVPEEPANGTGAAVLITAWLDEYSGKFGAQGDVQVEPAIVSGLRSAAARGSL
jgi:hypothetical protein